MKKPISGSIKEIAKKLLFYPIPPHLKKNQIQIDDNNLNVIKRSIKENFHKGWRKEDHYKKKMYEKDLYDHLYGRLHNDRIRIIPWLDNARPLKNSSILEIGCGTGSSSVALAEQGAKVIGIDIDEDTLSVAKDRCKVYGLEVELRMQNASEISTTSFNTQFDFIIFFACLEHMTINERLKSLKNAWEMLNTGGLLTIVETPNRLWYLDVHTSRLPFFHWLPNELAFKYSCFSPKENFRELYKEYNTTSKNHFLRRGRGFSFHEIDIAIKPAQDLKVISSLSTFEGIRYELYQSRLEKEYKSILRKIYSNIHSGFFDKTLYLIIEKDS